MQRSILETTATQSHSSHEHSARTHSSQDMGTLLGMQARLLKTPESPLQQAVEMAEEMEVEPELDSYKDDRKIEESEEERSKRFKHKLAHDQERVHKLRELQDYVHSRRERRSLMRDAIRFFGDPSDTWGALDYILDTLYARAAATPEAVAKLVPQEPGAQQEPCAQQEPGQQEPSRQAPVQQESAQRELDAPAHQALIDEVRAAKAELEEAYGPQIRAGIHAALEAPAFTDVGPDVEPDGSADGSADGGAGGGAGGDSGRGLRDFYRQVVCDFTAVHDVFKYINEHYGQQRFDRAMDFLFTTLGADLASDQPSMGMTHLEMVHTSLEKVRLFQNLHDQCARLLQRWEQVHGVRCAAPESLTPASPTPRENITQDGLTPPSLTPMTLAIHMVELGDINYLSAVHVEGVLQGARAPDVGREVLFLQEMLNMVRGLPPLLFSDAQGRMKVMDAVQQAVDNAIAREDAYLAQQGA